MAEEAALEPHGLGFKAGAACSYDSLRRLYWQQRKQQQSTHRNRRLLKPSLHIDFMGLNLDEGFVQLRKTKIRVFFIYIAKVHVINFTKFSQKMLNSFIVLILSILFSK